MGMQLKPETKYTRALNAVAVGTTDQNGSAIDMADFEGCLFILVAGTITGGNLSLKAQQDSVVGMGGAQDLAGTLTTILDADDNKIAVLDIKNPGKRFIRGVAVRGTPTGAVIDGMIAIQYNGRKKPTINDATVAAAKALVTPAEGTP